MRSSSWWATAGAGPETGCTAQLVWHVEGRVSVDALLVRAQSKSKLKEFLELEPPRQPPAPLVDFS